jgi:diguanylate cyclase (GGDEF)-like protein
MTNVKEPLAATVLVVERGALRDAALAASLGSRGHTVLRASDGRRALDMALSDKPDVVLTDILLPDMDACEFVMRLRARPAGALPRVVFRPAAFLEAEARALAHACGVVHVVLRSAPPERLFAAIAAALAAPPLEPLPQPAAEAIGHALRPLTGRLLNRVAELEALSTRLRAREAGMEARLEAARTALVQEVTKRIWAEADLTETNFRLRDLAVRDVLTGLHNRRYLEESLDREESRARRRGTPLGIMMIDIDHFKRCNDTFGHPAGDAVLRAVARYVHSLTRGEDILCRYGGEEFVLVMASGTEEAIWERAEQLRAGVQELGVEYEENRIGPVTLSIGVAVLPEHGETAWAVLEAADAALYAAKQAGRNRVMVASR